MNQGKVFILSAPSGTGKTTLLKQVMAKIEGLVFSVSHTTRGPRTGEVAGVDYHFIGHDEFLAKRDEGDFLESAEVHGNYYGTSKQAVLGQTEAGLDVILDIDVQGASIIKETANLNASYIFLSPPSLVELEKRLRGRAKDSDETIRVRLANAEKEMQAAQDYEYLIINDDLDIAAKVLAAVIMAERAKGHRLPSGKPAKLEL